MFKVSDVAKCLLYESFPSVSLLIHKLENQCTLI